MRCSSQTLRAMAIAAPQSRSVSSPSTSVMPSEKSPTIHLPVFRTTNKLTLACEKLATPRTVSASTSNGRSVTVEAVVNAANPQALGVARTAKRMAASVAAAEFMPPRKARRSWCHVSPEGVAFTRESLLWRRSEPAVIARWGRKLNWRNARRNHSVLAKYNAGRR